jgi:hypothetical protein
MRPSNGALLGLSLILAGPSGVWANPGEAPSSFVENSTEVLTVSRLTEHEISVLTKLHRLGLNAPEKGPESRIYDLQTGEDLTRASVDQLIYADAANLLAARMEMQSAQARNFDAMPSESIDRTADVSGAETAPSDGRWAGRAAKAVWNSASLAGGLVQGENQKSGIWRQAGLPEASNLRSFGADIQFNLPAKDTPLLSQFKNRFIEGLSANLGMFGYGPFTEKAQATSSGYANPLKSPIFEWDSINRALGASFTLQEELMHRFYVAAGFIQYKDFNHTTISQADCSAPYNCPAMKPETVVSGRPAHLGETMTIGKHVGDHGALELTVQSAGDHGWAKTNQALDLQYPPMNRNVVGKLMYRYNFHD